MSQDICASGTHVAVLEGDVHQTVTFVDGGNFNILKLTKDMSNYSFSPEGCWNTLEVLTEPVLTAIFPAGLTEIQDNALEGASFETLDFPTQSLSKLATMHLRI